MERLVGDGAGLLARFEDLAEVVLGEDDGVLLLHGVRHGEAHVEQVGAERQMRAVLFDDAEGQHADALRLVDGLHEVGSGELFPFGGEARLRNCTARERRSKESSRRRDCEQTSWFTSIDQNTRFILRAM